jgi:pyrroline-5-carboxylate reductase
MRTDIVVLCVKPQIMDIVCAGLKEYFPANVPILSIAAGKDIAYFEKQFSDHTPIIRTMPNLPATISKGMTALITNKAVDKEQRDLATTLMNACGETLWIDDESQMDAVTAVSGSGPAYIFYMVEAMTSAGEKLGLNAEQSMQLARQTVIGASSLLEHSQGIQASDLREAVTSKGGTTQAALEILMDGQFQDALDKALLAAYRRGKELAD